MAFYKSFEDMYSSRADRFKREGDRHWAMAKSGCGEHHYQKAKSCYDQAALNRSKAGKK